MYSPRKFRIHSATFLRDIGEDEDGVKQWETIQVDHCRITSHIRKTDTMFGRTISDTVVVTVDCADSPKSIKDVRLDDQVKAAFETLKIIEIHDIYLPRKNVLAFREFTCVRI